MDELSFPSPFADVHSGSADFTQMNKGVTPQFFVVPIQDHALTQKEGAPRFVEQELVRIIVAGDMLNVAASPVDDGIKERFADQYARWKKDRTAKHIEGTPLKEWPLASILKIAEFQASGIESVEHLAGLSDSNVVRIADGRIWRAKALAWLDAVKGGADTTRLAAENEQLRADMEDMRKTVAELSARIESDERASKTRGKVAV